MTIPCIERDDRKMLPRFSLSKLFPRIPVIYDLDIRKSGATRVSVTVRSGASINIHACISDARFVYNGNSKGTEYSIPLEESPKLYQYMLAEKSSLKFTIDNHTKEYVLTYLKRESEAFFYATAEDCLDMPMTFGPIQTRSFQRAALNYLEFSADNKILSLDMGLGKTAVALMFMERKNLRGFFFTKASLVHNLAHEIKKLTGKTCIILNGRRPDNSTMQALLTKKNQYFILNYEVIGTIDDEYEITKVRPWVDVINMMAKMGFIDCIVADEAHQCRNIKAKRTQALMKMDVKYKIPMTGTPIVNRVSELFPILHWIAPEQFPSEQSFLNSHGKEDGSVKSPAEFHKMLLPYMFRRTKKDVLKDLPPINRLMHEVEMLPAHATRYIEALKFFFLRWDGSRTDILNTLSQLTRLRQVIADAKADSSIDYVNNFLEESDEKILIFSYYVGPVTYIARELNCKCIYGDIPHAERMVLVNDFNNNPDTRVLVIQMQTGQEGLNLTAAKHILFNDVAFVSTDIEQAEARCYGRLDNVHGATSIQLVIDKTVDVVLNRIIMYKFNLTKVIVDGTNEYAQGQKESFDSLLDGLEEYRV